jgi:exopolysaccharide biosynthesis polyprenyl glycosylphosphotransferase
MTTIKTPKPVRDGQEPLAGKEQPDKLWKVTEMLRTDDKPDTLSRPTTSQNTRQSEPWTGWRLQLGDVLLIWLSFFISYYLRYTLQLFQPVDESNTAPFEPYIPYTFIFMFWMLVANQSAGLYNEQRGRTWASELIKLGNAATNAGLVIMALSFLLRPLVFSRLLIIQAVILTILLLGLWRLILRNYRRQLQKRGIGVDHVLIIGADELGLSVLRTIVARPDLGYRAVGFLDDDPERGTTSLGRVEALGSPDNIGGVLDHHAIDEVIITLPWEQHDRIVRIINECQVRAIEVRTVPDLFQLNLSQMQMESLGGIPLLGLHKEVEFNRVNHIIKRVFDLALVIISLPISLPLIALIAIAIRLDSTGAPFFGQERVGMNGKVFNILKFRTMIQNAEDMWEDLMRSTGEDLRRPKLADDPRVTRIGKLLRRTSLDELPNIFNVLRGDMSLIGPRPPMPREVELYAPWQYQRLKIRPGMTGLWQVSGRSEVPFDEMCLMDIYYIENWSLTLDLQILLQTAPRVVFRRGAY